MCKKEDIKILMTNKKKAENSLIDYNVEKSRNNQNVIETYINNFIDNYYKGKLDSNLNLLIFKFNHYIKLR